MAYPLRHDIDLLASERRRITSRLSEESDPEKVAKLIAGLAQYDGYVDAYLDVQGSDGPSGTTQYAQNGITKVNQILGSL